MTGIDGLYAGEPEAKSLLFGTVHRAPSSSADSIDVIIPSFNVDHAWGPCGWAHSASLPAKGAECLVALDDRGNAWVVAWR
jgi:hypothetical protein